MIDDPALWRSVFEGAPDALVLVDAEARIVGFNAAAERLFDWPAAELLGRPLARLGEGDACELRGLLAGDARSPREITCLAGDGRRFAVEAATASVEAGGRRLTVVSLRDAAERKHVEDALLDAEERLAGMTANLPGIVFQRVQRTDGSIYYPFFTDGVRDVLGFAPEEMRVNAEGCLDAIHWADRDRHMVAVRMSALDLQPCLEEYRTISRSGEIHWLSGTSRPHLLPGGEIIWDGLLIDITDRKRAELRLELVMDHAADGIITTDESGRIESVNAAVTLLFGFEAEELVGQPISTLMPEPFRSRHDALMAGYLETGEGNAVGVPREILGLRKDGGSFALELSPSEVRMEGRRYFIFVGRDITRRKQTEEALRETERRLRNIAANLPGIVFQRVLTPEGDLEYRYVSEGSRDVIGLEPEELVADASLFVRALESEDRDQFMNALRHSAETLEPMDDEVRVVRPDGQLRWLRGRSRPRRIKGGAVAWDGVTLDVTDRKEAEERLLFLAYYDPVTGVANRALFLDCFDNARRLAQRDGKQVAVLCLGFDRFSIINATHGHAVGDKVLAAAAKRLQNCLSSSDTIARAGGDRFMILLGGVSTDTQVQEVVERLLACCQAPLAVNGDEFDLTASMGISIFPRDGDDAETVVKNADTALQRAKSQGPGTVQMFCEEMNARALKTLSLQHRMRRALENAEFVPYYQPLVDLRSGRIVSMEALARWISPELGMVSPVEFIPVAEEYGLIDDLCDQILGAACRQNKEWQDRGLAEVVVAVNISGRQFHNSRRLLQNLESILGSSGLDPAFLELELTESSAMRDADNAIGVVRTLKEMGIGCAIDDFGTGYSSLSVLKRFPIQKLKIDRSFVMEVNTDANDAAIVAAMVAMAHALRLKVVAEGVELVEHLEFLSEVGCDEIQGYLVSRPLPALEMARLFAKGVELPPYSRPVGLVADAFG